MPDHFDWPRTKASMSDALKALESASRRELQSLAKELQLCRGNAKSDVIVRHAMQFLDSHPKDGEQLVMGMLSGSASSSPVSSSTVKKQKEGTKSAEKQPEDEPMVAVKIVQVVEKKTTPKKKNLAGSDEMTPKIKKKTKQTAPATKSTATISSPAKSPKASVKASPATKKSSDSVVGKKQAVASKKEEPATKKKPALASKKAEIQARKAVEALVKSVADLTFSGDSRVRCSTTGHEMKADVDVINAYINGKRYQKARNLKLSFAKYAPMFVDHPDESKTDMLWCNVTESAIARDEMRVKDHMTAPKYQKQLPIWKELEAAKKKAEEEEAQHRAARIEAAKKRRLEAANGDGDDATESKRPTKRKRTSADSGRK